MYRQYRQPGLMAMEGILENEPLKAIDFDQVEEVDSAAVEAGQVDVPDTERLDELEAESEVVDQLIDKALVMEGIRQGLSHCRQTHALTRQEAKAINLVWRGNGHGKNIIAMEMMQGRQMRLDAVRVSLEEIGETIRDVVRRIVEWVKRAAEVVYDHIEGIVRGANAVTSQAGALQDRAAKVRGEKGDAVDPANNIIKHKSLAMFFTDSTGKTMKADEIIAAYKKFSSDFNDAFAHDVATGGAAYISQQINAFLNEKSADQFSKEVALDVSDKAIKHMIATNFKAFEKSSADGLLVYKLPFGPSKFIMAVGQEDGKNATLSFSVKHERGVAVSQLPALKPSEVYEMMKVLESSMHRGIYRDYKQVKSALYQLKQSIGRMSEEISREQRTSYDGVLPSLHFLKSITEALLGMVKDTYSYNGKIVRAMMAYCHASLKKVE